MNKMIILMMAFITFLFVYIVSTEVRISGIQKRETEIVDILTRVVTDMSNIIHYQGISGNDQYEKKGEK